ncbi:hypothetical protein DK37_17680 [Halomonas sp. SUBG004]|nr:hypothetical protein DK37_17680 [Halomonas sp. SUBG004]
MLEMYDIDQLLVPQSALDALHLQVDQLVEGGDCSGRRGVARVVTSPLSSDEFLNGQRHVTYFEQAHA